MGISTEIILKRRIEAQERRYKEMLDAAEFEAKVAVKMLDLFSHSDVYGPCDPCGGSCLDCMMKGCAFEALKRVRLMVEEEMDG